MKLTNLVKNKIQIKEIDSSAFLKEYQAYISSLLSVVGTCDAEFAEYIESLQSNLNNIRQAVDNVADVVDNLNNKIQADIDELSSSWHKRGYVTPAGYTGSDTLTVDLERQNRSFMVSDTTKQKVLATIQTYSEPRYPCLEIGPGDGVWTHHLVASDPLYLVDIQQDFLDSTNLKFPEQYRRRLRSYLLDFDNSFTLDALPQNQFGFIFSWNVFDYFPITETKQYLESCFKVLRAGGRMVFSYNNCDTVEGANYAEGGGKSWMTEDMLIAACKEIGFEIEQSNVYNESWLCIKKPGELKTVKTHQALGEIINQNS